MLPELLPGVFFLYLPGMGNPAFCSLAKYFCTLLCTWIGVRLPKQVAIFFHRSISISSEGYSSSKSSSLLCSSGVQGWLKV